MKALHNQIDKRTLKKQLHTTPLSRLTLSFYKYQKISDPKEFRDNIYQVWSALGVLGRVYLAKEGINAQISVIKEKFESFKEALYGIDFLNGVPFL